MARLITIDIETYRTRDPRQVELITQEALEKRPASNTRKDVKLAWDTEEARQARVQEALSKTAVNPMLAEILCVVAQADDGEVVRFDGMTPLGTEAPNSMSPEEFMLTELRVWLEEHHGPHTIIAGHNIGGFDLGIILNRWRHYRITPATHFPQYVNGRWRGWVFDTMQRIPNNCAGFVGLDAACSIYGIEGKSYDYKGEPMKGSRVAEAYEAGDYADILNYCADDVVVELELYMAMTASDTYGTYGLIDPVAQQIADVDGSDLSDTQKKITKYNILEAAGMIPNAA